MNLALAAAIVATSIASVASSMAHADSGNASEALARLFADERAEAYRSEPLLATYEGVHDYDDRLPSATPAEFARRLQVDQGFLTRLRAIDRKALTPQEQISYDLFDFMVDQRLKLARYREWRMPFNSDSGFYSELLLLHETQLPRTTRDYENYIARLKEFPRFFDEQIANLRQGADDGFTLPAEIGEGVAKVIGGMRFSRAEDMGLWKPFATFPASVPEPDRARLTDAGRAAITNAVIPSFDKFRAYFENDYRPRMRKTIAASALPDGGDYYADMVRQYTTLPDATPQQVHQTGLAEVARIRAEMEAVMRESGFKGTFPEFLTFLRTDPQFYPRSAQELLGRAALITREIDGKLPEFFGHLPRTPYTIKPVPTEFAANYTAGRYNPGPTGAAGEYWVNTYALNTRPLYSLPALTAHEAAPGHHLQGAIARELSGLPKFRQNFYPVAFGEGWALYCERLGRELGIYHTPYERFGQLSYEMWRACRLVVDTGMHAMGWTRQQAMDYLAANTALSAHEIQTEVDRYIGWPGQALGYKIGEITITTLRRRAETELGTRFDIRAFHDAILATGGVTLPVLQRQIEAYIATAKQQ
jgi:uncharacterized protein (DUF885 family)